jgi:hypothetical protein
MFQHFETKRLVPQIFAVAQGVSNAVPQPAKRVDWFSLVVESGVHEFHLGIRRDQEWSIPGEQMVRP